MSYHSLNAHLKGPDFVPLKVTMFAPKDDLLRYLLLRALP
jgi:hypothetical protein